MNGFVLFNTYSYITFCTKQNRFLFKSVETRDRHDEKNRIGSDRGGDRLTPELKSYWIVSEKRIRSNYSNTIRSSFADRWLQQDMRIKLSATEI